MSNKLKVTELRAELEKRGLDTSGLKADLVTRLDDAIAKEDEANNTGVESGQTESNDQETAHEAEEKENDFPDATVKDAESKEAPAAESINEDTTTKTVNQDESNKEQENNDVSENQNASERKVSRSRSKSKSRSRTPLRSRTPSRSRSRSNLEKTNKRSRSKSRDRSKTDGTKLYIGNLAYRTEERDLEYNFKDFGKISDIFIPQDREFRRSKGFAFVTFENERDAEDAIRKMDQIEIDGRRIRVEKARVGGGGGGRGRGHRGGPPRRSYGGGGRGGYGDNGGRHHHHRRHDRSPPRQRSRYY